MFGFRPSTRTVDWLPMPSLINQRITASALAAMIAILGASAAPVLSAQAATDPRFDALARSPRRR